MRNRRRLRAVVSLVAIIGSTTLAFALLQDRARALEATVSVAVLRFLDFGYVARLGTSDILVRPHHGAQYLATITPSCSALASSLALICIGIVLPTQRPRGRILATVAAVALVVTCNLIRIVGSIVAGQFGGSGSLVLFHDSVGATFGFIYTLIGFSCMLYLLMPKVNGDVDVTPV